MRGVRPLRALLHIPFGAQNMSEVTDVESKHRFELEEDGGTAFVTYFLEGETITFTHTIVPEELEGRGLGSRLVRGVLDAARERGLKVVPACSFVRHYVDTHEEYRDLVAG
jgi:predicted GNAT family acetyltransferase